MKNISVSIALLLAIAITGCGESDKEPVMSVSIEPQRALLEQIVGDRFKVETLMSPGANPETFEPGMQTRRNLETSAVYFTTGYLPFEKKMVAALGDKIDVTDTSEGIEVVYGTHSHNHNGHVHRHTEADPHVWTSVKNAAVMAKNMYDKVVSIDPANTDYYTGRYETLKNRLDSLDKVFTARLGDTSVVRNFAVWHPSLSYFARDYGLNQIEVGYENKEMPATLLKKVIEKSKNAGVKVFFFQQEFDSRQAETLNKEMNTTLVTINPLSYDWEGQLDTIVSALCR